MTSYTLGVEEEYQIIDPLTHDLSSSAVLLLQEARKALGEGVQHEMQLSQIEVSTPICQTLDEVKEHITRLRSAVIAAAKNIDRQIAAAGTHPFAKWQDQQLSPGERYASLQHNYLQLAREQSIFACHVHVGLANRDEAIQVMNHARGWLALLLALTGNSPFLQNIDTGYASYRTEIWGRWPLSGPPQIFSSWAEYDALLHAIAFPGTVDTAREVYWDLRLSPRFPTIEVRIADVCLTIDEAVMFTGLVRALIQTCHESVLQGRSYLPIRQEIVRVSHWQAARYGLEAFLLDPLSGEIVAARQLLNQFLHYAHAALQSQGSWELVSKAVETIVQQGTGATRQRQVYQQTKSFQQVVNFVVKETARGT
jgi:glutamate---cysteine ligase / carboxylate-amine ligase